jgi:hypothetical protein
MRSTIVDTGIDSINLALLKASSLLDRADDYVDRLLDFLEADFPKFFDTQDWRRIREERAAAG